MVDDKIITDEYNRFIRLYGLDDTESLKNAFRVAENAHEGQLRHSGEPFFTHPLAVASILAELGMDEDTVIAGLLHDVIEDTDVTQEQIREMFSSEVANLVDGVTKLKNLHLKSHEEEQAESLRKMFLAMAADIRVVIIKLADRLHNMRTLKYQSENKQIEKSKETLEIYAPLAHRLGINAIKWELEDLSLKFLDPDTYFEIAHRIEDSRAVREEYLKNVIAKIKDKLMEMNIRAQIEGRPKHIYSIHKKMIDKNKIFEEVYDLIGIRIIVKSIKDCYGALGIVHTMWKPLPMRFKDYIAVPKQNMYQSLHTTLLGDNGKPFEIQIRTFEMHRTAEYGIAAHWKYKEGGGDEDMSSRLSWLRELMDWQTELKDSKEFMETLKIDLFADSVFVFTPKGDVHDFPLGAIPLDFAYAIHSKIGDHCVGAKINGKMVPLDTPLKTGDIVEIITSSNSKGPSHDWLNIVKTHQARSRIRQFIKKENKAENIQTGKEQFEHDLKHYDYTFAQLTEENALKVIYKRYSVKSMDDLYAAIGYGGISSKQIIARLIDEYKKNHNVKDDSDEISKAVVINIDNTSVNRSSGNITVKDQSGILVRLAHCCNPVYGDEIVGYITRGNGISVHRKDCRSLNKSGLEKERLIDVEWSQRGDAKYLVEIQVLADDRPGLLADVSKLMFNMGKDIVAINASTRKDGGAAINMKLSINVISDIEEITNRLINLKGVYDAYRVNG